MSMKKQVGKGLPYGITEAAIALEVKSGSRVAFSAVQPPDVRRALRYCWLADAGAVVLSPCAVKSNVLMPQVTSVTRVTLTLLVSDSAGVTARRVWPIIVTPEKERNKGRRHKRGNRAFSPWSAAVPYSGGSLVSHNGGHYQAKWCVVAGTEPGLVTTTGPETGNTLPWKPL